MLHNIRIITGLFAATLSLLLALNAHADNVTITQVSVSPQVLTAQSSNANIHFNLSKASAVRVKIFDAANALVWRSEQIQLPLGEHSIVWQGKNTKGEVVAPEAYSYVIEANAGNNEIAIYDLTDITGGENLTLQNLQYDSKTKKLKFTAPKTGRFLLRAGIAKAFAINTLINNKVVIAGEHEIVWDGYDASHVFDASANPQLQFGGLGFQLNSNTIIVAASKDKATELYQSRSWPVQKDVSEYREMNKTNRDDLSPGYYRAVDKSRDVLLTVNLPDTIKVNKKGAHVIASETPLTVNLLPDDIMVMEAQRGEIVLFLDGQLIHDNEVSYYPYTFTFAPKVYDGAEHLLTVFVAGFAGNIGIATLKVQLGTVQLDSPQKKAAL
ncbi:MAG: FlgD immunoglobulin-like domain containing protein [Pseudomonadota bacterium]